MMAGCFLMISGSLDFRLGVEMTMILDLELGVSKIQSLIGRMERLDGSIFKGLGGAI